MSEMLSLQELGGIFESILLEYMGWPTWWEKFTRSWAWCHIIMMPYSLMGYRGLLVLILGRIVSGARGALGGTGWVGILVLRDSFMSRQCKTWDDSVACLGP